MKKIVQFQLYFFLLLFSLLQSACQPIQRVAATSNDTCTDADKIALLQKVADGFKTGDAELVASALLPDATFVFDAPPYPNPETGNYAAPGRLTAIGRDQYMGLFQAIIALQGGAHFDNSKIEGNTITAVGGLTSPVAPSFGTPATDMGAEFKITLKDCKIAAYDAHYPESELATFPAKAAALGKTCSDDYKPQVFDQYINGIDNGDSILAALPYAKDAHYEFEPVPVWSETEQHYTYKPLLVLDGLDAFKPVIDGFISIALYKTLDLSSLSITGNVLNVKATLSTQSFSGDPWFLPVADVAGEYTITFNDECKISDPKWNLAEGSAEKFTELKKSK